MLAAVLFASGCQFGANRVTAEWDAEKVATAEVVAKQAEHVAAVTDQQSAINQEVSNEIEKAKAAIAAHRRHLLARVPVRVRVHPADHPSAAPAVPGVAARIDAATADPVSATVCVKLAEDAAHTTLMISAFQRWHREQHDANGNPYSAVSSTAIKIRPRAILRTLAVSKFGLNIPIFDQLNFLAYLSNLIQALIQNKNISIQDQSKY